MNIHITNDDLFINRAVELFETYYPGENLFFVISRKLFKSRLKYVENGEVIEPVAIGRPDHVRKIKRKVKDGDRLFIHYLSTYNAPIALSALKRVKVETYWIFFGSDLYGLLHEKGMYPLLDGGGAKTSRKSIIRRIKNGLLTLYFRTNIQTSRERFIQQLDHFCFWNHHDYNLLKSSFSTRADHRSFKYFANGLVDQEVTAEPKKPGRIILNHSASKFGNHETVIEYLSELDSEKKLQMVITPLSYGSGKIRKRILQLGQSCLPHCFYPITEFLPSETYFSMLSQATAAIFGHKRQEGSGNVFRLLAMGIKVFLRKDNNLLQYLREKGYHIFCYEQDLHSLSDLNQLDEKKQEYNRKLVYQEFSYEEMNRIFHSLI